MLRLKLSKWALPAFMVAVALGILIAVQFQLQQKVNAAKEVNNQKIATVNKLVQKAAEEKQAMETRQAELKKTVESYRNAPGGVVPEVKEKADIIGILSGETAVEGPGIHIEIDDSNLDDSNRQDYNAVDHFLTIVNALKYAGAEAIAVSNQRIGARTYIQYSGPSIVMVNGVPISRVDRKYWVIEAIGNQQVLKNYVQTMAGDAPEQEYPGLKITYNPQTVKIPSLKTLGDFTVAKPIQ